MAVLRYSHKPSNPQSDTTTLLISTINNTVSSIQSTLEKKVTKSSTRGLSENNYSTPEKNKLHDIEDGAEVNVQADWNETDTTSDSYILNKPNVPILDPSGQIPAAYLPSYVDDVLEYNSVVDFPAVGEKGKIYVDASTDIAYRWSGSTYIEISKSIVTGVKGDAETDYRIGNINLTAANIGLSKVVNLDLSKAIKMITRSGTTFTYTCLDGTTGTFTLQDTDTWRGIQDNLTSSTNTTESLSAKQGYLLANGSARDNTKLPLAGGTMTGSITMSQGASTRNVGIIGTYDPNRAAAIWSMGSSYQINANGTTMGSLYGACYAYYGSGYTYGAGKSGGHSFVWAQNGNPTVALGDNVWTTGGFIKNGSSDSYTLLGGGGHKALSDFITTSNISSLSVNYATKSTYLYSDQSPYRISDSVPYYAHIGYNINGVGSRWYLRMYPETPRDIAVDYAISAGNASTVGSIGIDGIVKCYRNVNQSMATSGYWCAMSTQTGIDSNWRHVLNMDWTGSDVNNWMSQLSIPTAGQRGVYYRSINGSSITNATWIKLMDADGTIPWSNVTGTPTIPTKTSQLTNDSGYIKASVVTGTCNKYKSSTGSYYHYYISMSNADAKKIIYIRFWDSSGNSIDPQYYSTYSLYGVSLSNVWHYLRQADIGTVTYKYSIEL